MSLSGHEFLILSRKVLKFPISNNSKVFYFHLLLSGGSSNLCIPDISRILSCSDRSASGCVQELFEYDLIIRRRAKGSPSHYEVVRLNERC